MDLLSCDWDHAKFFLFSGNVSDGIIYYSHFVSLFTSLVMGFFVFLNNRRLLINKVLLLLTISFSTWVLLDLILWATGEPEQVMFFWSIMTLFELLFYFLVGYVVYLFINKRDFSIKLKFISGLLFLPVIFLTPARFNLSFFDYTNCELNAVEGWLWQYIYTVEGLIILSIIVFFIKNFKTFLQEDRKKNILFVVGAILLLSVFSFGNIALLYEIDWKYEQYKLFGMPFFVGLLAYLIVKYKTFNIKLIGAQALVVALNILIGSQFFFIKTTTNRVLTGITLLLSLGFGWVLIQSVKKEVAQREELEIANEKLKKLDQAKSEFISIASHQLRTPLTVIKGYVSMILDENFGALTDKLKDPLNKVFISNQRLIDLVESLLNVSRIESGRLQLNFENKQLEDLVASVCEELTGYAAKKSLKFEFIKPATKLPPVRMDEEKMRQVVMNLVDNSIKYTPKGSVTVTLKQQGDKLLFCVSDSGIGVRAEDMPNMFKKFSRGTGTSLIHTEGTGLGLYVVKEMIEVHGGRAWIESAGELKGSKFFFEMPFVK